MHLLIKITNEAELSVRGGDGKTIIASLFGKLDF